MATVERFEDLQAWQKARVLTREVYLTTTRGDMSHDWGLRNQMQRAAVSIMANIAEGFDRHSDREFHQFLVIAKGSAAELRSHLHVALDVGYIDALRFEALAESSTEVSRLLAGLMKYLKTRHP